MQEDAHLHNMRMTTLASAINFFPSFSLLPANTEAVPMSGDTCHANCHRLHQHAKALPVFQFTH